MLQRGNIQEPTVYRVVRWLIDWRVALLVLAASTVALAWMPANRLEFDRSVENMFAPDDPLLPPYVQLKRTFGGNEIALAAYVDEELMTPGGAERVEELTAKMEAVPGVAAVLSLTRTPLGTQIVEPDAPLREQFVELFEGYNIGRDRQTTAVVCMLQPQDQADVSREETVTQLREIIESHDETGVLTGEPVMVVDGFRYIEEDGTKLGRISTALLMLAIVCCFRSIRWVIVPIAVVNVTLLLTKALLVVGDFQLSMVSSMMWAIVTVTGIAMVIHIIVAFREARTTGISPRDALLLACAPLAVAIAWTCFTDAAGFGSLLFARVGPVNDFGKMMSLASVLALVTAAVVLPGLALLGRVDPDPKRAWGEGGLDFGLRQVVYFVERWPRVLAGLAAAIFAFSAVGYAWLEVETDFTKNFRESSPVVKAYQFVETNLGGAGVWDVLIPAPETLDWEFLDRLHHLQDRLRDEVRVRDDQGQSAPGLTKVLSLADALDAVGAQAFRETLPLTPFLDTFRTQMPTAYNAFLGADPEGGGRPFVRIMLRARERQPAEQKNLLIEQVREITGQEFPGSEVTGFFVLLTSLIDSMIRDQWITFSIAMIAIGLMMLMAFRSGKLALAALVPNALPILIVTGLMGWLGVRINMGSAMIAAVSLGLSIDSSIHYMTAYRRRRREGKSVHEAIDATHQSVGRAMVFSTLALMVGFSALTMSEFVPIIYFGVLVSLAMFGGLLGNLVLLPIFLRAIARRQGEVV